MAFGTFVQALLRVIVVAYLARLLQPADLGLAAAAVVVMGLARVLFEAGLGPALVQRPSLGDEHHATAFAVSFWLSLLAGAGIWYAAEPIATLGFAMPELAPYLRVIALLAPLQALGSVPSALLRRNLRFATLAKLQATAYMIGYGGVSIVLASAGFGVWALIYAHLAQAGLFTLLVCLAANHARSLRVRSSVSRELLFFGGGFAAARVANYVALNGDKWVIARVLGQTELGYYKLAYELASMVATMLGQVFDGALFPLMSRVQGDLRRLAAAYRGSLAAIAMAVLPVSAALVVLAPEIVTLVLGERWEPAIWPFRVFALVLFFRSAYKVSASVARATGAVYQNARVQVIYAGLVLGLSFLGSRWGVTGAAVGVSVAIVINFGVLAALAASVLRWSVSSVARLHLRWAPLFFIALAGTVLVVNASRWAEAPPLFVALLGGATGPVCALLALAAAPTALLGRRSLADLRAILLSLAERAPWLIRVPLFGHFVGDPGLNR